MSDANRLEWLEQASLQDLRGEWERRYGAVPRLRSVDLLRRVIAWRIQTAVHGGLDAATRRLIAGAAPGPEALLAEGTVLRREWQGTEYTAEITSGGFLHDGRHWSNLSEIARAITGTRWNGPRFFGLREAA